MTEFTITMNGTEVCGEPFIDGSGKPRICTFATGYVHDRHAHFNGYRELFQQQVSRPISEVRDEQDADRLRRAILTGIIEDRQQT